MDDLGAVPPGNWKGNNFPEGKNKDPVIWVNWFDAANFCQWAKKNYLLKNNGNEQQKAQRVTNTPGATNFSTALQISQKMQEAKTNLLQWGVTQKPQAKKGYMT
ncbi:MAG: hypothetical protein CM1200mP16_11610 [Nitrospina sp.]|nr:MAG: hypothetical protein CM1200mP16_11610 [Nitrospina sp.]